MVVRIYRIGFRYLRITVLERLFLFNRFQDQRSATDINAENQKNNLKYSRLGGVRRRVGLNFGDVANFTPLRSLREPSGFVVPQERLELPTL